MRAQPQRIAHPFGALNHALLHVEERPRLVRRPPTNHSVAPTEPFGYDQKDRTMNTNQTIYHVSDDPIPLPPLGDSSDSYAYPNGVIIYFRDGNVHIHNGYDQAAVVVPKKLHAVIVAACLATGLTITEAALLAEAAEKYA